MRQDGRLSRLLHVLIHMDEHEGPMTSQAIAGMLNGNAAVVRRTMGALKVDGYVTSGKGHGGGWCLTKPLDQITLADVYRALGEPELFALGLAKDSPSCLVEQAVNSVLGGAIARAESLLLEQFASTSLANIRTEFGARRRPAV